MSIPISPFCNLTRSSKLGCWVAPVIGDPDGQLFGAGLQAVGTDNAVNTGPYGPSGASADALFAHPDHPDGIAYTSRHDPEQLCIAFFSHSDIRLELFSGPTPLSEVLEDVASILRRYGKGIA